MMEAAAAVAAAAAAARRKKAAAAYSTAWSKGDIKAVRVGSASAFVTFIGILVCVAL
jgi:hypothetical protein